jgi:hypothetical protein
MLFGFMQEKEKHVQEDKRNKASDRDRCRVDKVSPCVLPVFRTIGLFEVSPLPPPFTTFCLSRLF